MKIETFLQFWSQYNTLIIEVLIGLILLTVIYLAFKTFFGPSEEVSGGADLRSHELEKTLQKILERQEAVIGAGSSVSNAGSGAVAGIAPLAAAVKEAAASPKEASVETHQVVTELRGKLEEAQKKITHLEAVASVPVASPVAVDDSRVKALEARLAEYEIIAEDIADLSFYKEENAKLQAELSNLRQGVGAPLPPVSAEPPALAPVEEAQLREAASISMPEGEASPAAPGEEQIMDQFKDFAKKEDA